MEPKVIFEDQDILVLDKPSGMIVNKSDTTKGEKTVQEWVESYLVIPNLFRDTGSNEMLKRVQHDTREMDFYKRAGIVHRLDKETSGILLAAKTKAAFENLQAQFMNRKVKKTYVALVHGEVEPKEGDIKVPVGRLPWNRTKFGVIVGGRNAITHYRVITNYKLPASPTGGQITNEKLTLLELRPETGRTHQIRVHLQYIHHPIFADLFYAGRKTSRNDRKLLPRMFLHATKIAFTHPARLASESVAGRPKTSQLISFESSLPKELRNFINNLAKE